MKTDSLFIPRSKISGFAQSTEVSNLLRTLSASPLMTRAEYEFTAGGMDAIINKYPAGGTPEMLILEHDGPMEELERLAEVSAISTQLIVISANNDVARYRSLLDKGGADYLCSPLDPERLLSAISRAFARAQNRNTGTLITFFSCGGGSGGSTMVRNAAVILSQFPDKRVMLLDFDIHTGTVAVNFDIVPLRGMIDLLRDPKSISAKEIAKLAQDRSASLQLLCSLPVLEPDFLLKTDNFVEIIDQARLLVDFVLIDMPSGWSALHSKLLAMSERVALVVQPNLGSFMVMNTILKLAQSSRQSLPPVDILENRWSQSVEKLISSKLFAEVARGGNLVHIGEFGTLEVQASEQSKVLAELSSRPDALDELSAYLAELSGQRVPERKPRETSFLARFFGRTKV